MKHETFFGWRSKNTANKTRSTVIAETFAADGRVIHNLTTRVSPTYLYAYSEVSRKCTPTVSFVTYDVQFERSAALAMIRRHH